MEKIVIDGSRCTIRYKLPVPATWQESEELVLPTEPFGGAEGIRTPYLLVANEALSQLSYSPKGFSLPDGIYYITFTPILFSYGRRFYALWYA